MEDLAHALTLRVSISYEMSTLTRSVSEALTTRWV
jgi:hypothetical protein